MGWGGDVCLPKTGNGRVVIRARKNAQVVGWVGGVVFSPNVHPPTKCPLPSSPTQNGEEGGTGRINKGPQAHTPELGMGNKTR